MKTRDERIIEALQQLRPLKLELINDSQKHAGHAHYLGGAPVTGQTHYKLLIICEQFENMSRIERQRLVMGLLKNEFESGLHALEIRARGPSDG